MQNNIRHRFLLHKRCLFVVAVFILLAAGNKTWGQSDNDWIGTTSDWSTASNWSGGVPTALSRLNILTGCANYPVIGDGVSAQCYFIEVLGDGASISSTGTGSLTLNGSGTTTVTGTATVSCPVGGAFNVTKSGAGTLIWAGANTYTGTTSIANGVLKLGSTSALGTTAGGTSITGGAVLDLNGINYTSEEALTVRGTGESSGGAVINSSSTGAVFAGLITIATSCSIVGGTGTISLTNTGTITGAGLNLILGGDQGGTLASILGTTSGDLTKEGNGIWTLSGTNTYTGKTTISAGTLSVETIGNGGVAGNLGAATNAAANLVLGGGTLRYTGATASTDRNFTLTAATSSSIDVTTNILTISGASTSTSGALTKTGAGTLTLSGASLYSGATTISAGTLKLGASDRISNSSALTVNGTFDLAGYNETVGSLAGSGTITSSAAGSLTVTAGDDNSSTEFSGVIENGSADAVGLTKSGTGTLTLSGTNTYTGLTTIGEGTLKLNNTAALGTTDNGTSITNNAILDLNGINYASAEALTVNGDGPGSGAVINSSATGATFGGLITLGSASEIVGETGSITLSHAGTITGETFGLTLGGSAGGTLTSILGTTSGTLTKEGTGTWILSGANTFTGLTMISAGILKLNNTAALGTADAGTSITSGAALDLNGITLAGAEALTLKGTGVSSGGALMNSGAAATYSGLITLGANSSIIGGTGSINLSNTGTITGAGFDLTLGGAQGGTLTSILGTGAGLLTKEGAGTWTLSGANTYTGTTTISAGTLKLGAADRISNSSDLTVNGTFDLAGYSETVAALAGSGTITSSAAGTLTLTAGDGADTEFSGVIENGSATAVGLTKAGTGILTLSGANTFTGPTVISEGTIKLNNAEALGSTDNGTSITNNAILDLNGVNYSNSEALTVNGDGPGSGAVINSSATGATFGGLITLGSASEIVGEAGYITLSHVGTITGETFGLTLGGTSGGTLASIIGTTSGTLTKEGSGTWTLSGASTYTGATTISAGTLKIGKADGAIPDASAVTVTGTLDLGGNNETVGSITGAGTITSSAAGTMVLTSGGNNSSTTFSGVIQNGTGTAVGLTKSGSGTLTLSGINTFTGVTTISSGTLKLSNTAALGGTAGGTTVSTGAVLDLGGQTYSAEEPLTINGTGIADGGAVINSSATAATFAGLVTLGGASSVVGGTGAITISNTGTITGATYGLTLGGTAGGTLTSVLGTTSGTLTKSGSGTWTLSGANTYTGLTLISEGTLKLNHAAALGATDNGTTVSSGATLDLYGCNYSSEEPLTINGTGISSGGALKNSSATGATFAGLVALGSSSSIVAETGTITLSHPGTITGDTYGLTLDGTAGGTLASILGTETGTLTKEGAGTWSLSGSSTFSGQTIINEGTLSVNSLADSGTNSPIGTGSTTPVVSIKGGATFKYTGSGHSTNRPIVLTSDGAILDASGSGSATFSGGVTGDGYNLELTGTGSGVESGIIGTKAATVTKSGTGTWTVSGANTYTGSTTIDSGILKVGHATALGTVGSKTLINDGGVLDLNGTDYTNEEPLTINGTGISSGGCVINSSATGATFAGDITLGSTSSIVGGTGTINISNSGETIAGAGFGLTLGGALGGTMSSIIGTGSGTLTKEGSGTWTLNSANTFTGTTTVNAGTLTYGINNALASANITVSGGTLDLSSYTESATGTLTVSNGATLKVGGSNSLPTFTTGYSFGSTSTVEYNGGAQTITGTTYGHLVLSGSGTKTVSASTAVTVEGDLTTGGLLSLSSDAGNSASLIYNGTADGNVSYNRYMTGASPNWHLISAPVSGHSIKTFVQSGDNSIATNGIKYGLGQYTENTNAWTMFTTENIETAGNFTMGQGFETLRTADGTVAFTGTLVSSGSRSITRTAVTNAGWNLIGNPFAAFLNGNTAAGADNFINTNLADLDASFANVYYWDLTTSTYLPVGLSDASYTVPPGQGFFVRSKDGGSTVDFTAAMRSHTSGTFKSTPISWPEIVLEATKDQKTSTTTIRFIPGMTPGLDPGYDAGAFEQNPAFGICTRLVEDNGINFAVQCLPGYESETFVIPVGLYAGQGSVVTFTAVTDNLPPGSPVYLEDRLNGQFTRLDEIEGFYSLTLTAVSKGSGRFYIHTRQESTGIVEKAPKVITVMAMPQQNRIRIRGPITLPAEVKIFDTGGRIVSTSWLNDETDNEVRCEPMTTGIYLLLIRSGDSVIKEKINWVR